MTLGSQLYNMPLLLPYAHVNLGAPGLSESQQYTITLL